MSDATFLELFIRDRVTRARSIHMLCKFNNIDRATFRAWVSSDLTGGQVVDKILQILAQRAMAERDAEAAIDAGLASRVAKVRR